VGSLESRRGDLVAKVRRSAWRRRVGLLAVALPPLGLLAFVAAAPASASGGETGQITISPATPASEPSGAPTSYSVAVSCEGTAGSSCGGGTPSTITIPLVGTNTVPANMSTWAYSAQAGTAGLITSGPTVVSNGSGGFNLVMTLDSSLFVSGYSGTISLDVTPPDNSTPDHTTWTLTPTLSGGSIASVTAPTPATGEALATPLPVITKVTADGGTVYLAGTNVTYNVDVNCNTGTAGNLYMTDGSLTDPLPAGMTFVSASPTPTTYNATTNTVTWTYATASSTPTGCAAGSNGAAAYQIVATTPDPAPSLGSQPLENIATFAGEGPDAAGGTVSGSTEAEAKINVVDTAPSGTGPCASLGCPTISKSSLAPLDVGGSSSNQYQGTYPGNWITTSSTPSYNVGQAPGSYQVAVDFPLTHTYETQVVDPLPCLDNVSGDTYSSDSPTATACTDPAFDTTVIEVSGPGLGEAVANGWAPTATETDNSPETLTATGSVATSATSAYYSIGDVGQVADIVLPATPYLVGNAITLTVWGYADSSLANTDVLANTATATPFLDGSPLGSIAASANLYIVGADFQLGIAKSFGPVGKGPGGTTVLNMEGGVNFPDTLTLTHSVVLTDLLPSGLDWANVASSGVFTVNPGGRASSTTTTATVTYTTDYEGLGRNLIRATIADTAFPSGGTWTITPPSDFFEMATPTQVGTYPNTDQIFLSGLWPSQIDPQCTTPTQTGGGISPATFESFNPMDLAGDGNTQEDYCQNAATMVVSPTGAAFSLTKTVEGNLDSAPKGGLGIGDASPGGVGTGTYGLTWTNVGSDTLDDPVIYDILPYVGDTGVSQGQADIARDSAFAPTFTSVSVPTGITVEYSESTNPCRNQVYADSDNPGCVNDWSTTAPSPLSDVKALEFIDSTDQYPQGSSFYVSVTVTVPNGDVNEVAWNSAATNASDVSDPSTVPLPAEPPKVGLVATTGPSLATTPIGTSPLTAYSTSPLSDSVTITGTDGNSGTLDWSLVGPVYPVPGGGCSALNATSDWSGAAVVDSGSITIPAEDGIVTVGPATVQGQGCYSWTEDLTLDNSAGSASLAAGDDVNEFVQALPYDPILTTTATPVFDGTNNTSTDSVTVAQSGLGIGNGAPTSDTMTWDLYGPATADPAGSCTSVDWTSFTVPLDSGTINVTGDGTYTTPASDLTSAGIGCYTYTESLPATTSGTAASTPLGVSTETFALITTPQPTTSANQSLPNPRTSVSDAFTISDTYGYSGTVAWSLLGPVAPIAGSCSAISWSGVTAYSGGNQSFTGNQTALTVPTGGTTVGAPGCYSWADEVTGPDFLGPSTDTGGGNTGEVFQVVPYQPTLATTAVPAYNAGTNTVTDTVVVGSSDLGKGNGAPASAVLTWTLYGPVPAVSGGCGPSDIDTATWLAAPSQTGTNNVVNGTNTLTSSVTLTAAGCYSYTDSLAATGDTLDVATTSPGVGSETFLIVTGLTLSTLTNNAAPNPRATVTDAVTITGTDGLHGTVTWSLVGPVTPIAGSCATVSWTGAPVRHAAATQTITGDGTVNVPTAGTPAGAPGCYSWIDTLTGPNYLGPTPVGGGVAGDTGETFLVPVLQPTLTTTIDPVVTAGVESATDAIVVAGTDIAPGNSTGAPTSDSMTWTLLGPVTPVPSGGCGNVTAGEWNGASQAATGTISVTANTTYTTPSTALALGSCYSYTETLAATTDSYAATSSAGQSTETTAVPAAAVVSTTANQTTPAPRTTVSDSVTITGTGGGSGSITWSLVGPVNPVPTLGCTAVTGAAWSGTTVRATGTQSFTGNQTALTVPTAGTAIGAPGCYSWVDSVTGNTYPGTTAVAAGTAGEVLDVPALAPTLTTTINPSITGGVESATDSIVVAGTDIVPGNNTGGPTSDSMTWTLLGPVTPVPSGGCANVTAGQWNGDHPGGHRHHHGDGQHHLHHAVDRPGSRELLLLHRDPGRHGRLAGCHLVGRAPDRDHRRSRRPPRHHGHVGLPRLSPHPRLRLGDHRRPRQLQREPGLGPGGPGDTGHGRHLCRRHLVVGAGHPGGFGDAAHLDRRHRHHRTGHRGRGRLLRLDRHPHRHLPRHDGHHRRLGRRGRPRPAPPASARHPGSLDGGDGREPEHCRRHLGQPLGHRHQRRRPGVGRSHLVPARTGGPDLLLLYRGQLDRGPGGGHRHHRRHR
jgi:hypothetical protein